MAKQTNKINIPVEVMPKLVETYGAEFQPSYDDLDKEYDVRQHDVFDPAKRPDKKKRNGNSVPVNRIGLPYQKIIVDQRVGFMNVGKISLEANPKSEDEERLLTMVKKTRDDNKMEFVEDEVATRLLSELMVAKLWFTEPVDPSYWEGIVKAGGNTRMRCEVLSPKKGDTILPVFDRYGNMVVVGRKYESVIDFADVDFTQDVKLVKDQRFDIYTAESIFRFRMPRDGEVANAGDWLLEETIKHSYGKIPLILMTKELPPWYYVQSNITRQEKLVSDFGDAISYNAWPTKVFFGELEAGIPEKDETGGAIQVKPVEGTTIADVRVIQWDQAPESVRLELETQYKFTFIGSNTVPMSMDDMKDLGNVSGAAYDRIFMPAHMAARKEINGAYGEGLQREINFLKSACAAIDTTLAAAAKSLTIKFDIPLFRINDDRETIDSIAAAIAGGFLSIETALQFFPWISDAEAELKRLIAEKEAAIKLASQPTTPTTAMPLVN